MTLLCNTTNMVYEIYAKKYSLCDYTTRLGDRRSPTSSRVSSTINMCDNRITEIGNKIFDIILLLCAPQRGANRVVLYTFYICDHDTIFA